MDLLFLSLVLALSLAHQHIDKGPSVNSLLSLDALNQNLIMRGRIVTGTAVKTTNPMFPRYSKTSSTTSFAVV